MLSDLIDDPKLKSAIAKEALRIDTGELLSSIVPEDTPTEFTATKVETSFRPIGEEEETDVEVEDVEMSYDGVIEPMDPAEWGEEMQDVMERFRELSCRRPMTAPFDTLVGPEPSHFIGLTKDEE
jgi:hypothetical protein